MTETKNVRIEKSPVWAALLSAFFPGVGFFYLGNIIKGVAYVLIFASLIVMLTKGHGHQEVVFALGLSAFYIFQIIDVYNAAQKVRYREIAPMVRDQEPENSEGLSLTMSVIILIIGIVFLLDNLNILLLRDSAKFWPLLLVLIGAKMIYSYTATSRGNAKKETEEKEVSHESNQINEKTGGQHE
ncbi:MAG: LiaI-LiaF-like domain-containing protein [Candidatus Omnitrophota bacterium]